ncbi:unnamed protein product [Spirodela intermedia]|uniref:Uncharacterized protein n=1 Tax=Spirodela intermedia TaxID=51605 RepID=A0A7I8IJJ3_SPIIN|nr:unnamed protein product [Spirodela intermedia]CAA6658057.1 unnamed protein product [Spirodela intermedia]
MASTAGGKSSNAKLVHLVRDPLISVLIYVDLSVYFLFFLDSGLLGDAGTGKSSIVLRFVKNQFIDFQESTIGAAFFSQTLTVDDASVKFDIWDTAGQERYHSLAPMYYRGAAAAIVAYDITNQWVQELQAHGSSGTVVALAGNKADLIDSRKVSAEEARRYAQDNGLLFMETSAKLATNVSEMFSQIAKRLIEAQPAGNPSGRACSYRRLQARCQGLLLAALPPSLPLHLLPLPSTSILSNHIHQYFL